ncbi:hypothetical protein [Mesobacillus selenatarsenatis]|uniref:Conserved protein n=1 Tax=Mesobacillus selenatarsenatis (strain DSM 18680 / JCM 14380 / FERM P-15431 / SF-1) TaxID=1321606 RepID=A0A0A8XBI7_MESS1|nr:hypothetical protein [Mesobacillus selenatarsenatis]GAM16639.1 conserved protein [Mesobacillus selenatarsenatis SF-1]
MNMKILAVVGISGAVMLGSVYSISANTSGYDLYKDALKKTHQLESTTMEISMDLLDNSKEIYSADTTIKTNRLEKAMAGSSTVSNGETTGSYDMYRQDGQFLVKKDSENIVYSMKSGDRVHGSKSDRMELQEDMEKLVDVLTKDLQQKIIVKDGKAGSKEVILSLSGTEIPIAANVMTSLMLKHAAMMNDRTEDTNSSFHDVKVKLPVLKEDIVIKSAEVKAKISTQNFVEAQDVKVLVTGKDAQGKLHQVSFAVSLDLTNVNETKVETLDLTNLTIEEVKHGKTHK